MIVRLLLAILIAWSSAGAQNAASDSHKNDTIESQVRDVKRLALAVLRQIKRLDEEYRDSSGEPIEQQSTEARRHLARVESILQTFESSLAAAREKAGPENRKELAKLDRVVRKHYDRAVGDFGPPLHEAVAISPLQEGQVFTLTGEARSVLGFSGYKRPNTNPQQKASAANFALGFEGQFAPAEKTSLIFGFDHDRKVQRSKQTNTRFGIKARQELNKTVSLEGGFDLSHYSDKTVAVNSFSDFLLFARTQMRTRHQRLNVGLSLNNHSYTNRVDQGYKDFTFNTDGQTVLGSGVIKARLRFMNRSQDVEILSHKDFNPAVVWEFTQGGSEVGAEYQSISHGNLDGTAQAIAAGFSDVKRYKLHLHLAGRTGKSSKRWGPELHIYRYPNNEEGNFLDLKIIRRTSDRDDKIRISSADIVYRHYSGDGQFDFLQLTYRKDNRPLGSGRYFKWNTALRAYLEQSDDLANLAPAHTADLYVGFGWIKSGRGWLQRLSVGPVASTRFFIDTERADAYDEDVKDASFIFPNPRNYIQFGLEAGMGGITTAGITWRADLRWTWRLLYAADPSRSANTLELDTRAGYPVADDWMLDGFVKFHRSRTEVDSFADLNKNDVGVQLRYLFDLSR